MSLLDLALLLTMATALAVAVRSIRTRMRLQAATRRWISRLQDATRDEAQG